MSGLNPLPTSRLHSSSRLTHAQAHQVLADFLERTEVDAAYRPDSILSERGPLAVSVGSAPNLTLHHLKRILQGMQGQRVGGDLSPSLHGTEEDDAKPRHRNKRGREVEDGPRPSRRKIAYDVTVDGAPPDGDGPVLEATSGDVSDWQDKDSYELAQSTTRGKGGNDPGRGQDRHPGAGLPQPADDEEAERLVNVHMEETGEMVDPRTQVGSSHKDKEERKRLKKLRNKEDKAKRAHERHSRQD